MTRMPREFSWMPIKYGGLIRPWQVILKFANIDGSNTGQFKNIEDQLLHYSYTRKNAAFNENVWEREPKRVLEI